MEHLYWHPSFDTGHAAIDADHHNLAALVKALADVISGPVEDTRQAADRLLTAVIEHFAHEERLMDEADYPFARRHKQVHVALRDRLLTTRLRLETGHGWHAGTIALFTEDFLFHHIDREDRPLAAHLLKQQK